MPYDLDYTPYQSYQLWKIRGKSEVFTYNSDFFMLSWQKGYGIYSPTNGKTLKMGDEVRVLVQDDTLMKMVVSSTKSVPPGWGYSNLQLFKLDFLGWEKNTYEPNKQSYKANHD